MLIKKSFYVVTHKDKFLPLDLSDFPNGPLPIVWNCNGLCRTIPVEEVENLIGLLKDLNNLSRLNKGEAPGFWWDTGWDINEGSIIRNLIGPEV